MEQGTAAIDDIRHVAFALVVLGGEQRLAEATDDFGWVFEVEQSSTDAVFAHRADAVRDDEPAGLGLDR